MTRELIVLGTASQVPTRQRSHNAYLLRFDEYGVLFDPGEGAQRQMLLAGMPASAVDRICLTHFHGDHCLGLPGVIQRLSLDGVEHPVPVHFPATGAAYFERLRHASSFVDHAPVEAAPIEADGLIGTLPFGSLYAQRLHHSVDSFGYRLVEPDGRRMLPDRLAAAGIYGAAIGRLQRDGGPLLDQVSEVRPGQIVAFVMDTGLCPAAVELAADADLLVIEATFLSTETELAAISGHLTAAQAGWIAAEAGVRKLVLTHFSQRYTEPRAFAEEAAQAFSGEIVVAEDLTRIPLPPRR
ncbi:ribonuclease Z [Hamadaea flava]|uniref:Ribonuclease Z n=1 Tax=Hamadaea flava TaxID=1742688 RepID=A0ABV8LPC8_9ACTN|nr:ribonuclease Z [Hamadaea flava]MCP2322524.1 ribonuclease Z [Hamadaea flava]